MTDTQPPPRPDPLADITAAIDRIRAADRTITCHPGDADRIRAALDHLQPAGAITVRPDPAMPPGTVIVIPTHPRPPAVGPACWESRDSRATLGGISATWPQGGQGVACWDPAPCPDAVCSREPGHPGRHMASLGRGWGHRIVAAWPGTHPPIKTDLRSTR